MSGMQSLNGASDSQWLFTQKQSRSAILEIDSWMPSKIQAISPLVDRLMPLIEGSQCVPGAEPNVELALWEALENAVVHGNQEDPETKVHIRCRCGPGKEISIVVTDQGKGFDFEKTMGNALTSNPPPKHGPVTPFIKPQMSDVNFK